VKTAVKIKYIEVLYGLRLKQLRVQQTSLAKELYNAVYSKFETGMGNGIDLTNAEIQLAEAQNDLDDAEKVIHTARYSLFNLIGLNPEMQKYSITFADSLQTNNIEMNQIEALAVLDKQPLYIAALHDYEAAKNQLKEARSNILPDIRFNYYKQDYGTGYNFNGFEVGLSIPIWFPFDQRGNIKIALAKQEEILFKEKSIELDMKEQIERAWHSYEASRATVNRYRETIKTKAEKLQSLAIEAYRLGEIDLLNMINAQQVYLNSQQRYLLALRDYYIQLSLLEKYLNQNLVY
jgi:cobalt-zinc-cadmium efflux system outer membrane protein